MLDETRIIDMGILVFCFMFKHALSNKIIIFSLLFSYTFNIYYLNRTYFDTSECTLNYNHSISYYNQQCVLWEHLEPNIKIPIFIKPEY